MEDLKMTNLNRAREIATEINELGYWAFDLCAEFCDLAGMLEEFAESDSDTFEDVMYNAAEKLGVEL